MMRRPLAQCLGALLLAATVTGCDGSGGTATAPAKTCSVERATELPVRFVQGHFLVPASINQTPVQLLVDTGSSASMLTSEAAAILRLPPDPHRSTTVHGTGGTIVTRNVQIESFEIGSNGSLVRSVATGHLDHPYQEDPPVAGLLGTDYLDAFDLELDVPNHLLVLWRVQHCAGDFLPWQVPHFTIPLLLYQPNRLVAHVAIDGHPVTALIDWGARTSTITSATATSLGVTPDMLAHDPSGTMRGVDQNEVPFRLHRFAELSIGPAIFRNAALGVSDLHVADVGMLLGVDYFRTRHVWLSYATEQMFVERRPASVPTESR
jgi:predicted aspartyl protease